MKMKQMGYIMVFTLIWQVYPQKHSQGSRASRTQPFPGIKANPAVPVYTAGTSTTTQRPKQPPPLEGTIETLSPTVTPNRKCGLEHGTGFTTINVTLELNNARISTVVFEDTPKCEFLFHSLALNKVNKNVYVEFDLITCGHQNNFNRVMNPIYTCRNSGNNFQYDFSFNIKANESISNGSLAIFLSSNTPSQSIGKCIGRFSTVYEKAEFTYELVGSSKGNLVEGQTLTLSSNENARLRFCAFNLLEPYNLSINHVVLPPTNHCVSVAFVVTDEKTVVLSYSEQTVCQRNGSFLVKLEQPYSFKLPSWHYIPVFGGPILVILCCCYFYTRKRKKNKPAKKPHKSDTSSEGSSTTTTDKRASTTATTTTTSGDSSSSPKVLTRSRQGTTQTSSSSPKVDPRSRRGTTQTVISNRTSTSRRGSRPAIVTSTHIEDLRRSTNVQERRTSAPNLQDHRLYANEQDHRLQDRKRSASVQHQRSNPGGQLSRRYSEGVRFGKY